LDFHSLIRRIAFKGRPNPDSVVGRLFQLELEAEDKIRVLLLGEEISAAVGGAFE